MAGEAQEMISLITWIPIRDAVFSWPRLFIALAIGAIFIVICEWTIRRRK